MINNLPTDFFNTEKHLIPKQSHRLQIVTAGQYIHVICFGCKLTTSRLFLFYKTQQSHSEAGANAGRLLLVGGFVR